MKILDRRMGKRKSARGGEREGKQVAPVIRKKECHMRQSQQAAQQAGQQTAQQAAQQIFGAVATKSAKVGYILLTCSAVPIILIDYTKSHAR